MIILKTILVILGCVDILTLGIKLLLYCRRILSHVHLKGGWVRVGEWWPARPGPLVLGLGIGLHDTQKN